MDGIYINTSLPNSQQPKFKNDAIFTKVGPTIRKQKVHLQTNSNKKTGKRKHLWKTLSPAIQKQKKKTLNPSKRKHEHRKESGEQRKHRKIEETITTSFKYPEQTNSYKLCSDLSYSQTNFNIGVDKNSGSVQVLNSLSSKKENPPKLDIISKGKNETLWLTINSLTSGTEIFTKSKTFLNNELAQKTRINEEIQFNERSGILSSIDYDTPTESISEAQEITISLFNSTDSKPNSEIFSNDIFNSKNVLIKDMEIEKRRYYQNIGRAKVNHDYNGNEPYKENDNRTNVQKQNCVCNSSYGKITNEREIGPLHADRSSYNYSNNNGSVDGTICNENDKKSQDINIAIKNNDYYGEDCATAEFIQESKDYVFPFRHSISSSKKDLVKSSSHIKNSGYSISNVKPLSAYLDSKCEEPVHEFSDEEKDAIKNIDLILSLQFSSRSINVIMCLLIIIIVLVLILVTTCYIMGKLPMRIELIHIVFFNLVALFVLFAVSACASREVRVNGKYVVNSYFKIYWHLVRKKIDKKFSKEYLFIEDWYGDDKYKFVRAKLKEIEQIEKKVEFNGQSGN